LPFPATIAAFPCGVASIAHPTGARPARKATSMLLTVTSPATPAWGARAPVTDKIVRTCTSAAAELGPVTHVEQPDATTDGAAGAPGEAGDRNCRDYAGYPPHQAVTSRP